MGKELVPLGERKVNTLWVKGKCCQWPGGPWGSRMWSFLFTALQNLNLHFNETVSSACSSRLVSQLGSVPGLSASWRPGYLT